MAGINKTNLPAIFTFHDNPANAPKFIRIREAALEFAETVLDNTPAARGELRIYPWRFAYPAWMGMLPVSHLQRAAAGRL